MTTTTTTTIIATTSIYHCHHPHHHHHNYHHIIMDRALRLKLAETWHHAFGSCVTEAVDSSLSPYGTSSLHIYLTSDKQIWECVLHRHRK